MANFKLDVDADSIALITWDMAERSMNVINTGVIATPDVRFYPVSIDRFIREILDQEFRE